jgi:hypothetical protein
MVTLQKSLHVTSEKLKSRYVVLEGFRSKAYFIAAWMSTCGRTRECCTLCGMVKKETPARHHRKIRIHAHVWRCRWIYSCWGDVWYWSDFPEMLDQNLAWILGLDSSGHPNQEQDSTVCCFRCRIWSQHCVYVWVSDSRDERGDIYRSVNWLWEYGGNAGELGHLINKLCFGYIRRWSDVTGSTVSRGIWYAWCRCSRLSR